MGPNAWFSLVAGSGSLLVVVLAVLAGSWAVAVVFGLLAIGFLARGTERFWRGGR